MIVFTIFTGISIYFVYYNWCLIKNVSCIKFNTLQRNKDLVSATPLNAIPLSEHINGTNKTNKY